MNNLERELKLQAYLDGELPATEAAEVERWLDADAQMLALSKELRWTKTAIQAGEKAVKCPETREFYWSKIERAIELEEHKAERETKVTVPFWRKLLLPIGALAALVLTLSMLQTPTDPNSKPSPVAKEIQRAMAEVEPVNDSMGAVTFTDQSAGVTLIWHYDRSGNNNI